MRGHILILVENLSVPFDRRVSQESRALKEAGYQVTVICPQGTKQDTEREPTIDGVRILRYPLREAAGGPLGYLREYSLALWHTIRLALTVRREGRIDVVHSCNPPDLFFIVALVLRFLGGTRSVFDQHDLRRSPATYPRPMRTSPEHASCSGGSRGWGSMMGLLASARGLTRCCARARRLRRAQRFFIMGGFGDAFQPHSGDVRSARSSYRWCGAARDQADAQP